MHYVFYIIYVYNNIHKFIHIIINVIYNYYKLYNYKDYLLHTNIYVYII